MRSRYTAYARGDAGYLTATWHPTTRRRDLGLDEPVKWIGLEILSREAGGPGDTKGKVEFVARYKLGGRAHRLHERSRFQRREGRWYYLDGDLDPSGGPDPGSDGN
jgi:SEC-C motif-containing protein